MQSKNMCVLPCKDSVNRRGVAVERKLLELRYMFCIPLLHTRVILISIISVNVAEFLRRLFFMSKNTVILYGYYVYLIPVSFIIAFATPPFSQVSVTVVAEALTLSVALPIATETAAYLSISISFEESPIATVLS